MCTQDDERSLQPDAPALWSRRTLLASLAAVALPAAAVAAAPRAAAASRPTSVVYSPHPDDELLRCAGYVTAARQRGNRLVLVAVTDGGASSLGPRRGLTREQVEQVRIGEQTQSWTALAGPTSTIIRLRYPDGAVRASTLAGLARALDARYGPQTSHVAACHPADANRDHAAIAQGLARAGLRRVSYGLPAPQITSGAGTLWTQVDPAAAMRADDAYAPFGHESVPEEFAALRDAGYASRLTS